MTSSARYSTVCLVAILVAISLFQGSALEVGDSICVQGYVMDYFCINNGDMIDTGRPTLKEPFAHTVHCLVDVGICNRTPFEVLTDPVSSGALYTRGYRITEETKPLVISAAKSVGSCSTCVNGYSSSMLNEGFRAVMKATVMDLNEDDDDAPPLIIVEEVKPSNDLGDDPCLSEFNMMEEDAAQSSPTKAPTVSPATNTPTAAPTPPPSMPPPTKEPSVNPVTMPTPGPSISSIAPSMITMTLPPTTTSPTQDLETESPTIAPLSTQSPTAKSPSPSLAASSESPTAKTPSPSQAATTQANTQAQGDSDEESSASTISWNKFSASAAFVVSALWLL